MGEARQRQTVQRALGASPVQMKFALLADFVSRTAEGKLIIAGVFDKIVATKMPATHPVLYIAMRFEGPLTAGSLHRLRVELVGPDARIAGHPPLEVELKLEPQGPGRPMRKELILALPLITFAVPGRYHFRLVLDGREVDRVPFDLVHVRTDAARARA
jgi:hypothetical protein